MVSAIADMPIKTIGGRTIYIHDVAYVRDGFSPQTNVVHVDGKRGVLQPVLKADRPRWILSTASSAACQACWPRCLNRSS